MLKKDERKSSLERIIRRISGEDIYEGTPVPIPNTAVKLVIADNSKGMPPCEDRNLPDFFYV